MNRFRKILSVIGYIGVGGAPLLAATGVGAPAAVALGGLGLAAGAILHFLDSPKTPQDVIDTAKVLVEQGKAVKAATRP